jgi:FtsZ-interacting cell division protein ZipA
MAPRLESAQHQEDKNMQSHSEPQRETPLPLSRPNPRPPRSQEEIAKIRVKNRRREYLERNPAYFQEAEHEFAGKSLALFCACHPNRLFPGSCDMSPI